MMQKRPSKDTVLFRRQLMEARPYWGHISLIFVVSVLATPLALLIPLPLKIVVDSASEADIIAAAKAANAHDFIIRLPDGYATVVGERGMSLSGGEHQRISIARAFWKNAPILILDEPTSALDTKTRTVLMEAMERLMRGRTSLTIAHRLSTVWNCDWCLHFEDGRVAVRRANAHPDEVLPNEALA